MTELNCTFCNLVFVIAAVKLCFLLLLSALSDGLYGRVNGKLPEDLLQGGPSSSPVHPCGESLPTNASRGGPPTLAGIFGSVSCGVTAPLLWVLVCTEFCLCPPRLESLFPLVLWESYNQILLALKARFLGIPSPFVGSLGWEA